MSQRNLQTWTVTACLVGTLSVSAWAQNTPDLQAAGPAPANTVWLDTLNLSNANQGYGTAASGAGKTVDGHPITLNGKVYPHGFGTHAVASVGIQLNGQATHFDAVVGVDDETGSKGSVGFSVVVDGKIVDSTQTLHGGDTPIPISVDLTGAKILVLRVSDGGDGIDYDHADWAGALITLAPNASSQPQTIVLPSPGDGPPRIVFPAFDPAPAIHGARVVGSTPGYPFLYHVGATGAEPLKYSAKGLPDGLTLNAVTGNITGALKSAGTFKLQVTVTGPNGKATRDLTIVGGTHKLALTPPMGWNSWNCWGGSVTEAEVRDSADEMISAGLAEHGYTFVNIDDTWEADRDAQGNITSNKKFPNMNALTDYIHAKGLHAGLYSSPGPKTCAGYPASYQHEQQDANTYAQWGFDYLKYDWCSYGSIAAGDNSLPAFKKPYIVMRTALDNAPRDITYSLCQYGMGDVWNWGASVGGNVWRTTGDIVDQWNSMRDRFENEANHPEAAGPGHWNDPDMLVLGVVGWGNPHPTRLTPNEQITHMSMWCMVAAPLLIGCDMTKLDKLTLAILTNDEVIDINQDPLGVAARKIKSDPEGREVWSRPLFDGTQAVALVDTGDDPQTITVNWSDLGIKGAQPVRDLWLHKNLGNLTDGYRVLVPAHATVLLKVGKPK